MPAKRFVHIHGGGLQLDSPLAGELWLDALRAGLQRDKSAQLTAFDAAQHEFVYYGDLQRDLAAPADMALEQHDRRLALGALKALQKTKDFKRVNYERLPGKSSAKEFAADVAAPLLRAVGLGQRAVARVVPELAAYWQAEHSFAQAVDERVEAALRSALESPAAVSVVSHGVGSVFAYNALWRLSHGPQPLPGKVSLWLTLGSPLADDTVKTRLAGWSGDALRRYPTNIVRWHNVAAEDDYLCHDETVANDFAALLRDHRAAELVDHRIYNLAVRFGRSAPNHSAGYLIHPRTSALLADWCADTTGTTDSVA